MQGEKQGLVHQAFSNYLRELRQQARKMVDGYAASGQRGWQIPTLVTDLFDLIGISDGFDRQNINTNYETVMLDPDKPGTVGDVIMLKQQIDYLTMAERAFRLRHITPCRAAAFATGTRDGHSTEASAGMSVFSAIEQQVSNAMLAGAVAVAAATSYDDPIV